PIAATTLMRTARCQDTPSATSPTRWEWPETTLKSPDWNERCPRVPNSPSPHDSAQRNIVPVPVRAFLFREWHTPFRSRGAGYDSVLPTPEYGVERLSHFRLMPWAQADRSMRVRATFQSR